MSKSELTLCDTAVISLIAQKLHITVYLFILSKEFDVFQNLCNNWTPCYIDSFIETLARAPPRGLNLPVHGEEESHKQPAARVGSASARNRDTHTQLFDAPF